MLGMVAQQKYGLNLPSLKMLGIQTQQEKMVLMELTMSILFHLQTYHMKTLTQLVNNGLENML